MNEVHQDTDISNRISYRAVHYKADITPQNTITIDVCKCVTHSMVGANSQYHTRNQNKSSSSLDAL